MYRSRVRLGFSALILFSVVMLARPYSADLLRYVWWRISGPGCFVSPMAHIDGALERKGEMINAP